MLFLRKSSFNVIIDISMTLPLVNGTLTSNLFIVRKCFIYGERTQWLCLYASERATSQGRCKHSMICLLQSFCLHGCFGTQPADCLWDKLNVHKHPGHPWTYKLFCSVEDALPTYIKLLLQAYSIGELRLKRISGDAL